MASDNKKILIHNKFYKLDHPIGKDYCHNNDDYQSSDRLYTIIDQVLTCHVKMKSRLVAFFYNYWFYNNDFKKQKSLSSKSANKMRILINSIFWLSIIGLILCLIFGLALPIIKSAFDSYQLFNGDFEGSLVSNGHIIGWVVTQTSLYPTINSITTALNNGLNGDFNAFINETANIYLKYYLIEYYIPTHKIIGDPDSLQTLKQAAQQLLAHLDQNLITNFKYVYFTNDIQVLTYFSLVNGSLSSQLGADSLIKIFSSYQNAHFLALTSDNIFYGLRASHICLKGNQTTQTLLIPDVWAAWFSNAEVIVPMCFTLLFLAIIIFHYSTIKKNNPKFTSMNMYDYVSNKIKFTKKSQLFLKRLVFLSPEINDLKHNFIFGFQKLDSSSVYNTLRLLNYAFSSVESMSIILVADYDAKLLETYKTIIKNDTKNLAITIINDDKLDPLYNKVSSNKIKANGFEIVNTIDDHRVVYDQYRNYLYNYLQYWQDSNDFLIFKKDLLNVIKVSKKEKLTISEQNSLVSEISKENINFNKNQMFNKAKISFKAFNSDINVLISKLLREYEELQDEN